MDLLDHTERYVTQRLRAGELAPAAARNERSALRRFATICAGTDPGAIGPAEGRGWVESLDGLAPATRRRYFSMVRGFCRWALAEGILTADPLAAFRSPRQPRTVPRGMDLDAVGATLAACPDARARLIVVWMVQLGLRCAEMARVELGDIDRAHRLVRIRGKGGHERILPVVPEAYDALTEYLGVDAPAGAGPLIRSRYHPARGLCAGTVSQMVAEWMWAAGVKHYRRDGVSAHALRHTAASDMLRAGAHLRDIQAALGHAHLATTEIYLPYAVRGLEDAMGGRCYGPRRRPDLRIASKG